MHCNNQLQTCANVRKFNPTYYNGQYHHIVNAYPVLQLTNHSHVGLFH